MKTKLFKTIGIVAVAVALFIGYDVYLTQEEKSEMSDIMLENIEALSQNENNQNFECLPPYDKYTCSYVGNIRVPGFKYYK